MTLSPPDMLCFALYSATHAMQQVYKPLLDQLGLTYPQYLLMSALWTQDARTVGALGRDLALESNTLTPLIKRLEVRGLVSRQRDRADERRVIVRLTDKGHEMQAQARHIPACVLDQTGLTAEQAQALRDQIKDLSHRLRDAG